MSKLSKISLFLSLTIMVTSYVVLYITFLIAYLNPTMSVLVTINTYGEANCELILLTLSAPFIWYGSNRYLSKECWRLEK